MASPVLETILGLINFYTAPLYTVLYRCRCFFIDYWSLVHFISGFIVISVARRYGCRHPFLILGAILFAWEVTEMVFIYAAIQVFKPETIPDQFMDIVIGFAGGYVSLVSTRLRRRGIADEQKSTQ